MDCLEKRSVGNDRNDTTDTTLTPTKKRAATPSYGLMPGGVFPEWKVSTATVVQIVKLAHLEQRDRELNTPSVDGAKPFYFRLKCPHCAGHVIVRGGSSFHKHRNTIVRRHLKVCTGWHWLVPPPRPRQPKPMINSNLRQTTLAGMVTIVR